MKESDVFMSKPSLALVFACVVLSGEIVAGAQTGQSVFDKNYLYFQRETVKPFFGRLPKSTMCTCEIRCRSQ